MQDNELLELCKEVYLKLGWYPGNNYSEKVWVNNSAGKLAIKTTKETGDYWQEICPAYSLEYLLEKLPKYIELFDEHADDYLLFLRPNFKGDEWNAGYSGLGTWMPYLTDADTPLKALLKLTLALKEAGEL